MINALLNNLFLFNQSVSNWLEWSKIAVLSYLLSLDFVYFVIAIAKKKEKERAIIETDLKIKKDDCKKWDGVNGVEASLADVKVPALAAAEVSID